MSKSISMKKVGAVMMTLAIVFFVNSAISSSISRIEPNMDKQVGVWKSLTSTPSVRSSGSSSSIDHAAEVGTNPPRHRLTGDLGADMGTNPTGPRPSSDLANGEQTLPPTGPGPSSDLAADMGTNPTGPRPSGTLAADMGTNPTGPRPSVTFSSAGGSFPTAPRPTI